MLGLGQAVLQTFGLTDYCADSELLPPSAPGQLEFTSEPFTRKRLLAGPIAAHINATSTTRDTMLVATVSDVGPDGKARTLSEGALLGSNRALDDKRTWRTKDGRILLPYHPYTRAAAQPVEPGKSTTYDIQIAPTFATIAPGHRIKVTIASGDFPHLLPTAPQLANLVGGVYTIDPGSSVVLPFVG
jgi:predicted acyl esterase